MKLLVDCGSLSSNRLLAESDLFLLQGIDQAVLDSPGMVCLLAGSAPLFKTPGRLIATATTTLRLLPGPLGRAFWIRRQVPALAKKFGANLLLNLGRPVPARVKIPELLWLPQNRYSASFATRMGKMAAGYRGILTDAHWLKQEMLARFPGWSADTIAVLDPYPEPVGDPPSWTEREHIKVKYAGGKDYFVITQYLDSYPLLIELLKSFSVFKKKQQSNMQLLLTGVAEKLQLPLSGKLETYKYRSDIHLYPGLDPVQKSKVIACAYGYIQPYAPFDAKGMLNAFSMQVPVMVLRSASAIELAGDAASFIEAGVEGLSACLALLYKDEGWRNACIQKGTLRAREFTRERFVQQLIHALRMAVKNS
jgi:glycosyltransferase involved in cell wall biosynthesis